MAGSNGSLRYASDADRSKPLQSRSLACRTPKLGMKWANDEDIATVVSTGIILERATRL